MGSKKKTMGTSELRTAFLEFFRKHYHTVVPSSPLVPGNDPTLAVHQRRHGAVQGRLPRQGRAQLQARRELAALRARRRQAQRPRERRLHRAPPHLLRDARQLQLRRLLQAEAIEFAWELRHPHARDSARASLGHRLPGRRRGRRPLAEPDQASTRSASRRMDESSNFWAMGDTGPCGPCTEIFYDHGPEIAGGPPGSTDEDGDRYVEIWNLVFMQFERSADGTMTPLPKPSVDTGMGLERTAAVMQGVHSNYDIDLFRNLIRAAAKATHATDLSSPSLRVIADHIRACSFLIADGVIPGNDGRGYVLRRIIRRAIRHGYQARPAAAILSPAGACARGRDGRGLSRAVKKARTTSSACCARKRSASPKRSRKAWHCSTRRSRQMKGRTIEGDTVFKLYDTYGFPADLTADIARERGLAIDQAGFERAMEAQRERARAASKFGVDLRAPGAIAATSRFRRLRPPRQRGPDRRRCSGNGAEVASAERGRRGAGRPRSHPVLCRVRRPGRRHRRPHQRFRRAFASRTRGSSATRTCTSARSKRASFSKGDIVTAAVDAATPPGDRAQPFRHAPAARGAAQGARQPRARRRARWSRRTACASIFRTTQPVLAAAARHDRAAA